MSDHIKSQDLCERCNYAYERNCGKRMKITCFGCVMYDNRIQNQCKCLTIKENTPCPYFEEDDDD